MDALKRAEELRQNAVAVLLEERGEIEAALKRFGWGEENGEAKRRGRPPKQKGEGEPSPVIPSAEL